jgi:hypothetical protein
LGLLVLGAFAASAATEVRIFTYVGYLPAVGPGPLRFKEPIPPGILALPALAVEATNAVTNSIKSASDDLASWQHDLAEEGQPYWPVFPELPANEDGKTVVVSPAPPLPTEAIGPNTNSGVVTPQMLVPFFKSPASGTNSSRTSLIVPVGVTGPNPAPPRSSKATLASP